MSRFLCEISDIFELSQGFTAWHKRVQQKNPFGRGRDIIPLSDNYVKSFFEIFRGDAMRKLFGKIFHGIPSHFLQCLYESFDAFKGLRDMVYGVGVGDTGKAFACVTESGTGDDSTSCFIEESFAEGLA